MVFWDLRVLARKRVSTQVQLASTCDHLRLLADSFDQGLKYLPIAGIMEQFIFINERGFFPLYLEYILIKRAEACVYQIIRIILRLLGY